MAKVSEVAVDTNVAIEMIKEHDDYVKNNKNSQYLSNKLNKIKREEKSNSQEYLTYIGNRLEQFNTLLTNHLETVKDFSFIGTKNILVNKLSKIKEAQKEFEKVVKFYKSTKLEEDKFLAIEKLSSIYDNAQNLTSSIFAKKRDSRNPFDIEKQIKVLDEEIKQNKDLLNAFENNPKRKAQIEKKILISSEQRLQLALRLKSGLNEVFCEKEDNKYKLVKDKLLKSKIQKNSLLLTQKMVKGEVEIVIPEFVYEELCNHTIEFNPKNAVDGTKVTNGLVSKLALDSFTKNCTLSLVKDKEILDYLKNVAFALRKGGNYKKERNTSENFKQDIGSCGKFSDSMIAVYSSLSGLFVVTNNRGDFVGSPSEIAVITNDGKNEKVVKLENNDKIRNHFRKMVKNGFKFKNNEPIFVSDGEVVTLYEYNDGKFNKMQPSKIIKHVELTPKMLEQYEKELNKIFKHKGWSGDFKKITELKAEKDALVLFGEVNRAMNEERIKEEEQSIKQKSEQKNDDASNQNNSQTNKIVDYKKNKNGSKRYRKN